MYNIGWGINLQSILFVTCALHCNHELNQFLYLLTQVQHDIIKVYSTFFYKNFKHMGITNEKII